MNCLNFRSTLVHRSLVFCVVLYRSFFPFSFGHNIVCPSMICMVYVAQSLVFCVVLYRSFFPFSFGHNIVCPSMICVVYVAQSLVFRVVFCRSLFGHCVVRTFSDARHLITSLVSSKHFSYKVLLKIYTQKNECTTHN